MGLRASVVVMGMAVMGACAAFGQVAEPAGAAAVAPDPVPATPEKGPFLFSYFLGNGDGLHLAASTDGLTFTPLNGGKTYLKPTVGGKLMRDPCVRQGPDGMYHLVWSSGWWDKGFGASSSPDLVHWDDQLFVEVQKHEPTAVNTWAPELFYDDAKGQWLIFWATTVPEKFKETVPATGGDKSGANKDTVLNHRIYYVTTKDFKTFSETKLLIEPGFNCIDATIVKSPAGKYVMVLKDETVAPVAKKNLRTATADAPEGPWSKAGEPFTPDKLWVEGPTVARVGETFYVYYDEYRDKRYGAMRTNDFAKWEVVKENFSFPAGARHGTVFPVTEKVLARLKGQ